MQNTVSFKSVSGTWNFADDGGSIGAISLGVFVPQNSIISFFCITTIRALTSGGLATVGFSLNTTGGLAPIMLTPAGFAAFTGCQSGVLLTASPIQIATTGEFTMNIAVAALTAGEIQFVASYYELAPN